MPEMMPPPAPPPAPNRPVPPGPTGMATGTPQNAGLSARVPMLIQTGMKPLMEALSLLDPMSEQAIKLHKFMAELAKEFGHPSPDMTRADQKLLGERSG